MSATSSRTGSITAIMVTWPRLRCGACQRDVNSWVRIHRKSSGARNASGWLTLQQCGRYLATQRVAFGLPVGGEFVVLGIWPILCSLVHHGRRDTVPPMRALLRLATHLLITVAKLLRPGRVRAVAAKSLPFKHQILISNRYRRRAPNLTTDGEEWGRGYDFVTDAQTKKACMSGSL